MKWRKPEVACGRTLFKRIMDAKLKAETLHSLGNPVIPVCPGSEPSAVNRKRVHGRGSAGHPVGEELAGGKRGRVRLLYDDGGNLHDNGDDWPAEAPDYQFVAITYQFDTRMSRPRP